MIKKLFLGDCRLVNEEIRTFTLIHVMGRFKHKGIAVNLSNNAHGMAKGVCSPVSPMLALHVLSYHGLYLNNVLGIGNPNSPHKTLVSKVHVGVNPFFYAIP